MFGLRPHQKHKFSERKQFSLESHGYALFVHILLFPSKKTDLQMVRRNSTSRFHCVAKGKSSPATSSSGRLSSMSVNCPLYPSRRPLEL